MASSSQPPVYVGIDVHTNIQKIEEEAGELDSSKWEYDVFLCFRGCDTRNKFVSHLYNVLTIRGFHVFKDDIGMQPGDYISQILEVIPKSMIAIVVISKNFATSSFCLKEIVKILECKREKGQIVLPIFYEIDLVDEKKFKETNEEAFRKHEEEHDADTIKEWKKALNVIAGIIGWDSLKRFDGNEAELIKCIVREVSTVSTKLNYTTSAFDGLVGIDSHVSHIEKQLDFQCADVRMIGIWGIGGIGKTTIANSIFHKHSRNFESYCFLENVKDKHIKYGDIGLQQEFLGQVLSGLDQIIHTVDDGRDLIHKRLHCKKVFIVLDDMDDLKQLNILVDTMKWFGVGSRIIVTTRDKHLLVVKRVHYIHEVHTLNPCESLILFSRHAFMQDQPENNFWKLSEDFVTYACGLPLALKILGTFLCGLELREWESELDKLKKFPNPTIYQVLKISYDGLKDNFLKNVFLDIAFFFIGEDEKTVRNVLCGYGCPPESAIRVLKDRALVTVDHDDRLFMHDLILEMAHSIVKEESENLYERSRLSDLEDVSSLLMSREVEDREIPKVKGISLSDMSRMKKSIYLKPNTFKKLNRLRILKFCMRLNSDGQLSSNGLDYLSQELWYLRWDCFPFNFWPSNFSTKNLVELRLRWSKLEYLWIGEMELPNLKVIDLSYSKCLKSFPNLSRALNVEEIYLYRCENVVEFPSSLAHLTKLTYLTLSCNELEKSLDLLPNTLCLQLCGTAISKFPLDAIAKFPMEIESADVWIIGICGMAGIGKTTIAKSFFNKYSSKFDYSCFLVDVRDKHEKVGETGLQKELLGILGVLGENIHNHVSGCDLIRKKLSDKKVFIVLDDVSSLEQLNVLASDLEWFGPGSRILITTRDHGLLALKGVEHVYDVRPLDFHQSLDLFYRYAFGQDQPEEGF